MSSTKTKPIPSNAAPSGLKDDEPRELQTVAAALPNSSRIHRLITYIGEKYFQDKMESLHEYDIATEVYGRSKDKFNSGEDAIVRVEAHRLRKRLTEYYEGEERSPHPYFDSTRGPPSGIHAPASWTRKARRRVNPAQPNRGRWPYYVVSITALSLIALAGYMLFRAPNAKRGASTARGIAKFFIAVSWGNTPPSSEPTSPRFSSMT